MPARPRPRRLASLAAGLVWVAFAAAVAGCGESDPMGEPAAGEGPAAAAADPFSGTWRVKGMTTDIKTGDTRRIEGMVVLERKNGEYTASAELETKYPAEGGAMDAHVIGTGHGTVSGGVLSGTAETQLVMGTVPGIEAEFAFIPRMVGPRIRSTWSVRANADGSLAVELHNEPGEGEEAYSPTTTRLTGKRAADREAQP